MSYSKNVIYALSCKDTTITEIYVGHTTCKGARMGHHRRICNDPHHRYYNLKVYQYIREHGGWQNWEMKIIEEYPCNSVDEAKERERYWFETLNAGLNMVCPVRSNEERLKLVKEYYYENKEEVLVKNKNRYYSEAGIQKRIADKDKRNEYLRDYRAKNSEKYNAKQRERRAKKKIKDNSINIC